MIDLMTPNNFGKTLHFETYLTEVYSYMLFECLLDARTVMDLGIDVPALHQQYYGSLPPGVPNNYRAYKYAKFYDVNNNPVYLGVPWIRASSITENANAPYIFTVWGIDQDAANSIQSMLIGNGITTFEVTRPS